MKFYYPISSHNAIIIMGTLSQNRDLETLSQNRDVNVSFLKMYVSRSPKVGWGQKRSNFDYMYFQDNSNFRKISSRNKFTE